MEVDGKKETGDRLARLPHRVCKMSERACVCEREADGMTTMMLAYTLRRECEDARMRVSKCERREARLLGSTDAITARMLQQVRAKEGVRARESV